MRHTKEEKPENCELKPLTADEDSSSAEQPVYLNLKKEGRCYRCSVYFVALEGLFRHLYAFVRGSLWVAFFSNSYLEPSPDDPEVPSRTALIIGATVNAYTTLSCIYALGKTVRYKLRDPHAVAEQQAPGLSVFQRAVFVGFYLGVLIKSAASYGLTAHLAIYAYYEEDPPQMMRIGVQGASFFGGVMATVSDYVENSDSLWQALKY